MILEIGDDVLEYSAPRVVADKGQVVVHADGARILLSAPEAADVAMAVLVALLLPNARPSTSAENQP